MISASPMVGLLYVVVPVALVDAASNTKRAKAIRCSRSTWSLSPSS